MGPQRAAPVLVLVHSPVVGPATWTPVARELRRRDRRAVVPSLLGVAAAPPPLWRHCPEAVRAATDAISAPLILVGHSGAGPLLPAIADVLPGEVAALVFVDAFLPPPQGHAELAPPGFMAELRQLATDGVLPPWSDWLGEQGLRELVPDEALRRELEREMPRLPLAYFEATVPMPDGWEERPCGYLLLSRQVHGQSAAEVRGRGWPLAEIEGAHHLALVTEPAEVTDALLRLERALVGSV